MKYLALVAACLLTVALGAPLAGPAVADDGADPAPATPTFSWPDVTAFNPAAYTYQVVVSGEGAYPYRVQTSGGRTFDVAGPGTYDVPIGPGEALVHVYHCDPAGCDEVATSPDLLVVDRLNLNIGYGDSLVVAAPGTSHPVRYTLSPVLPGTVLHWSVVPRAGGSSSVESGDVTAPTGSGTVTVQAPPDGQGEEVFDLRLSATLDGGVYGHLSTEAGQAYLRIDDRAPKATIKVPHDTFYPLADMGDWGVGIPDHVEYTIRADEDVTGTRTIFGPDGTVVEKLDGLRLSGGGIDDERWYGRDREWVVYPEGRYEIRYDLTDQAGHTVSASTSVYLSHAVRHAHRTRKTVPAARTVVDRFVGSCNSLSVPSSHGWTGSVGYASLARCKSADGDNVTTLNRLYLPSSFTDSYGLKVYYDGAAARGAAGSRIAAGFVDRRGKVTDTNVTAPGARWNILPQVNIEPYVRKDDHGRHYVLWVMGTAGGNRYDVRSIRYDLRYRTFS